MGDYLGPHLGAYLSRNCHCKYMVVNLGAYLGGLLGDNINPIELPPRGIAQPYSASIRARPGVFGF